MNLRRTSNSFMHIMLIIISLMLVANIIISVSGFRIKSLTRQFNNVFFKTNLTDKESMNCQGLSEILLKYGFIEESVKVMEQSLTYKSYNKDQLAQLYYEIAIIFFNNKNFEKALMNFLRAKFYGADTNNFPDINQKKLSCLNKLNLKVSTDVVDDLHLNSDAVEIYAKINHQIINKKIYNKYLDKLPLSIKKEITKDLNKKKNFLKFIVLINVLYNQANKFNLSKDPEMVKQVNSYQHSALIQAAMLIKMANQSEELNRVIHKELIAYYNQPDNSLEEVMSSGDAYIRAFYQACEELSLDFDSLLKKISSKHQVEIYDQEL